MPEKKIWPKAKLDLDPAKVAASYARLRDELWSDPVFVKDAKESEVTEAELDRRMALAPTGDLTASGVLWKWLQGPDHYRWAGLKVLTAAYGTDATLALDGPVVVPEGEARIFTGHVTITGSLELEPQAMVMVLGRLSVIGALVADRFDYTLVAAREVTCANGFSGAEVLALEASRCPGTFYFTGNDYAARARLFEGSTLVDFERPGNVFGEVKVATRFRKWDFAGAACVLGLDDEDNLPKAFAAKLLGS